MCATCHVVSVDVEFNSLEAVKTACERMGWEFRENQTRYHWVGRWYDDSPVPRNLFTEEAEYDRVCNMTSMERKKHMRTILGRCTHAIHLPGAEGEIGIIQRGDKFVPIWDFYAHGLMNIKPENGIGGFVQAYATERAILQAKLANNYFSEHEMENGSIQLKINIPEY